MTMDPPPASVQIVAAGERRGRDEMVEATALVGRRRQESGSLGGGG
jgi:hypothetical protein